MYDREKNTSYYEVIKIIILKGELKMKVKNILSSKWFGLFMAGGAAVGAFLTERDNQQKEAELKALKKTVENLDKKVNG